MQTSVPRSHLGRPDISRFRAMREELRERMLEAETCLASTEGVSAQEMLIPGQERGGGSETGHSDAMSTLPQSASSVPHAVSDPVIEHFHSRNLVASEATQFQISFEIDSPGEFEDASSPRLGASAPVPLQLSRTQNSSLTLKIAPKTAVETLHAANTALEQELQECRQELMEKSRALDELDLWAAEFDDVKQSFEKDKSRLDACRAELAARDAEIELLNGQIAHASRRQHEDVEADLQTKLQQLSSELTSTRREKQDACKEIERCREQLAQRNAILERLVKELEACSHQLCETKGQFHECQMLLLEADRRSQEEKAIVETLERELGRSRLELKSSRDEAALLQKSLSEHQSSRPEGQEMIRVKHEAEAEIDELRGSLDVCNSIIADLEKNLGERSADLDKAEREKDVLTRQLHIILSQQEEQAWDSLKQDQAEELAQELACVRKQRADDLEQLLMLQKEREQELEQFILGQEELKQLRTELQQERQRSAFRGKIGT